MFTVGLYGLRNFFFLYKKVRVDTKTIEELDFVDHCLYFPEVDSTNSIAAHLASVTTHNMDVIRAGSQRAGRGRNGRSFFSHSKGGLWISLALGKTPITNHFHVNRSLSLAILGATLREAPELEFAVKWPNDILCRGKKTCGILLESVPGRTDAVVVGFGLNVNIPRETFPEDLRPVATSLYIESGRTFDQTELLRSILIEFNKRMNMSRREVHGEYLKCMYGINRNVCIDGHRGIFEGVLEDGRLVLREGRETTFHTTGTLRFTD